MEELEEIRGYFSNEFKLFEKRKEEVLNTSNPLLQKMIQHFTQKKGKYIRPMLVFLSAKICSNGELPTESLASAVALELLHEASLIHDDVVDTSNERHGMETLNAIYNNKIAVLVGDFFISVALREAIETEILEILKILSLLAKSLAQGEIEQLSFERGRLPREEEYLSIIDQKTASLMASSAKIGAVSVGAFKKKVDAMERFGRWLGRCFQIKDDILDYFPSQTLGKPTGNDIKEGKITLPLLYALQNSNEEERKKYLTLLSNPKISNQEIDKITAFAVANGGINYSEEKMKEFSRYAEKELAIFPNSEAKRLLLKLNQYIIKRNF